MVSSALEVKPLAHPPDIDLEVPGSKSHTNRALICAALAVGRSRLQRVLFADDTEAMLGALDALGVAVRRDEAARKVEIDGWRTGQEATIAGAGRDCEDTAAPLSVDVRQSGTTSRFLLPVLAATTGRYILDGDPQLRARPFGPQLVALRELGAEVEGEALPLSITGRTLRGDRVAVESSISSQFLSGLLLSAPLFSGPATIEVVGHLVSQPYVDLTVSTMALFGVEVGTTATADGQLFTVDGAYQAADVELEPDASAASYFFAAAAITGGRVRIDGLGSNTVQGDLGFVELLAKMGAKVRIGPTWTEVRGTGSLRGITVDMADISDTAQTLAVVAAFADSPTEITGIGFIRFKETDRIGAVVTELGRLGLDVTETEDGMIIRPGTPTPGRVNTYDDHRMAMSFALLGLRQPGIEISNPGCVSKTFPDYFDVLERLRTGS